MASVFISTPSEVVLIDARARSGTVTLPVTNQIAYRVVSFKDQYGAFSNSTFTLSTQTGETFDDGTTTKTFSNAFTSLNLYAATNINRWMVMNATQTVQQTISSLITNQIIFGTGAGWVQFGPLQATIVSSIQQTTALSFITRLSTNQGNFSSVGVNCNTPGVEVDVNGAVRMSTLLTTTSGSGRKAIFYSDSPATPFTGTYIGNELQASEWRTVMNTATNRFTWGWTSGANVFTEWARMSNGMVGIANTSPSFPLDVGGIVKARYGGTGTSGQGYFLTDSIGNLFAGGTRQMLMVDGAGISTGMYFQKGTNNNFAGLHFYTTSNLNVVSTLCLDANTGFAGVNCNTPAYTLDVNGFSQISTLRFPATLGRKIVFWATSDSAALTGAFYGVEIQGGEFRNTTNTSGDRFSWGWTSGANVFTQWATLSNGNFGINCNTPAYFLDVNGFSQISTLRFPNTIGRKIIFAAASDAAALQGAYNGVEIGATENRYSVNGTSVSFIYGATTGVNAFTEWARLSNGNMGIGCNNPGVTLDVAGTARSFSTITSSITLASGAGWTTTGALQAVALSSIQLNTALTYISSLYVGSTTTQRIGPYAAWLNGDIKINRMIVGQASTVFGQAIGSNIWDLQMIRSGAAVQPNAAWVTYSDQRIKENIVDADLARCYNDIKNVPLRRFQYISSFFNAVEGRDRHVLGFVAQEVSSIIPKAAIVAEGGGLPDFNYFNIEQLNMSLYGAVKKTIADKELLESTVKGQRFELQTLEGTTSVILSTLEGLQGR